MVLSDDEESVKYTYFILQAQKRRPAVFRRVCVVLGRIELPTHGFSVHCSTI